MGNMMPKTDCPDSTIRDSMNDELVMAALVTAVTTTIIIRPML